MKLFFLSLILTAVTFNSISQDNQKSLLWKITNPNTEKTSYLYGTMHISGRLAFHLGDEFFDAIESTDAVALESNPIIWLDEIFASPYANDYLGKYGFNTNLYKGFYQKAFKVYLPENKDFQDAISYDHYLSNWMLYRENKSKLDFQEETFLDLFIYQAGKKSGREVYSLEDFSQSTHFSKMGSLPDLDKKEPAPWYTKMKEDKEMSSSEMIKEAYRNKDVLLLDSIHSQLNSEHFIKYMLETRNDIMATRIDSFIQKENTSLFIGIGAAHLAGKMGVIQMLRELGYTVEPMTTTITDETKKRKETYDKRKKDIAFNHLFESELFSVKVPGKMYETPSGVVSQRQFFSPELTNGSFFTVRQVSTYSYFSTYNQDQFITKIDSVLFESIPGDIESKKVITKNGFKGLDVINKTTSGNYQRYQFILTPLNLFIFKFGAKDDFALKMGDNFFNSIELKPVSEQWTTFKSLKNDVEIKLPDYFSPKGNTHITSLYDQIEIEAFDPKTEDYYFLKRASLFDFVFIEEDQYELNRIAEQFCKNIDIDSVDVEILKDTKLPTALASAKTPKDDYLKLKIVINGPFYYLLAQVSKADNSTNPFFDSFKINPFKYNFEFTQKADSTLYFTTKSNYLSPTIYNDLYVKSNRARRKNLDKVKKDDAFKSFDYDRYYFSENYEEINVLYYKFHDYAEYKNIDSLWASEERLMSRKNKLITHKKNTYKKDDYYVMEADFTDTNSCRVIKTKFLLKHGVLYRLLTTTDTIQKPSEYITQFYDNFTPFDTLIGVSIFEDKSKKFIAAIHSEDSLTKEQAFESISTHIRFDEEDVEPLMDIITNYNFPEKHIKVKKQLITDLGKLEDKRILPFLEDLYPKVEDTAMYQIAILKALANQKSKKAYKAFTKLLDYDIPLSSSDYGINSVFYPFYDSVEISKEIYPEVLNYSFVKAYKQPTYFLLSNMVKKGAIKGSHYRKKYKQILREAKIELKSQISYEQSEKAKDKSNAYYYKSYKNEGNSMLVSYTTLLMPFYNKPAVKEYFQKLSRIEDYKVRTDIAIRLVKMNIDVPASVWDALAEDLINRKYLFDELKYAKMLDLYPAKYKTQNLMVESLLYSKNFNIEKDSMAFVSKELVEVEGREGYVYFYKSKGFKDDDWELDYVGLQPKDQNEINIDNVVFEKGVEIEKHKTIEEVIEDELESINLIGHKRAKKRTKALDYGWFNW
ncbi:MAG: TraB/GumN family protein [Putridiphycobacter sp.]